MISTLLYIDGLGTLDFSKEYGTSIANFCNFQSQFWALFIYFYFFARNVQVAFPLTINLRY